MGSVTITAELQVPPDEVGNSSAALALYPTGYPS